MVEASTRGRPFQPGQSGNPKGKPRGTRNATSLALEALLEGEGEELTRKAIEMAKAGDMTAMRLCMDRIYPPRKDRRVSFDLPAVSSVTDVKDAAAAILKAVAEGDLTPLEAADVVKVLQTYTSILETTEFEERLAKIEASASSGSGHGFRRAG
jgi:hypothetical protein